MTKFKNMHIFGFIAQENFLSRGHWWCKTKHPRNSLRVKNQTTKLKIQEIQETHWFIFLHSLYLINMKYFLAASKLAHVRATHFVSITILVIHILLDSLNAGSVWQLSNWLQLFHHFCQSTRWVRVAQSCPTLCDPKDYSSPGSSIHGILQARILEWVAISFSRETTKFY